MKLERNWGRLDMKSDFITKPLSQLASIQTGPFGSQLHKKDYVKHGTPIVTVEHLGQKCFTEQNLPCVSNEDKMRLNKYILRKGDIVFSRVGAVDRCSFVSKKYDGWLFSGRCLRVRPSSEIEPEYLYYFFNLAATKRFIRGIATGATMPSINTKFMGEVPITYPNINIQRKIVAVLNLLDEKVQLNTEINKNLEQQVSVLYQSWFEDFEITNGVCPEDWSYQELSSIADIASGKRPPVKSNVCNQETPISIVGAASVMGFTSEANHTDKILVTGRVGTHGVVQRFNTPCWTSDNTLIITSPYYEFTNQILHRIDYSTMNRGSTQPLITQGDMKKVVVLVPDENTLAKFEEFAGSLMVKWEANNKENVKLASLRDTLLPKLMSGELDVSDIEL